MSLLKILVFNRTPRVCLIFLIFFPYDCVKFPLPESHMICVLEFLHPPPSTTPTGHLDPRRTQTWSLIVANYSNEMLMFQRVLFTRTRFQHLFSFQGNRHLFLSPWFCPLFLPGICVQIVSPVWAVVGRRKAGYLGNVWKLLASSDQPMEIHLKNAIFSCCLKLVINSPAFSLSLLLSLFHHLSAHLSWQPLEIVRWFSESLDIPFFQMYYFFLKYSSWKRSQGNGIWPNAHSSESLWTKPWGYAK